MKAAEQLRAAETELVKLKQWKPLLLKIKAEIQKEIDLLPRRRNLIDHAKWVQLTAALQVVDNGFTYDVSAKFPNEAILPVMEPMLRRPGLIETDERIARLEADCKEWRAHEKRWPTAQTRHSYRYTGRPYKATFDGKELVPGDIVQLSEGQAIAWADRFEPAA